MTQPILNVIIQTLDWFGNNSKYLSYFLSGCLAFEVVTVCIRVFWPSWADFLRRIPVYTINESLNSTQAPTTQDFTNDINQ